MSDVRVLVSHTAFADFADRLTAAAPHAQFLVASPEGVATPEGAGITEPDPDVVWFSNDLFSGGGGAAWFVPRITAATSLRWLHSSTAGLDSPLFQKLMAAGITVTNARIYEVPVSEFVLRSVLDRFQAPDRWAQARERGEWAAHDYREVSGTTWVVVGMGRIGSAVAQRAAAFGAVVIGVDPVTTSDPSTSTIVGTGQLADVVRSADVVVLTAAADPSAPPIIDAPLLAAMRPDAVLVNVARGSLVDEDALVSALDAGTIGHAILDVTTVEPLPASSALWTHPAVTLTPHTAGQGTGRYARGAEVFAERLAVYSGGAS